MTPPARFYLPSNGALAAPVSPAFDAAWDSTGSAFRSGMRRWEVVSSPLTAYTVAETSATATNVLIAQYVSDPLAAGSITGQVYGCIAALESSAAADIRAQMVVRVVSNDGTTVRGTLLAATTTAISNEFDETYTVSRLFPPGSTGTNMSAVTASANDRLVIEVGYRAHNTSTTSYSGTLVLGDGGMGDLPAQEGVSSPLNPFFHFSSGILLAGETGSASAAAAAKAVALVRSVNSEPTTLTLNIDAYVSSSVIGATQGNVYPCAVTVNRSDSEATIESTIQTEVARQVRAAANDVFTVLSTDVFLQRWQAPGLGPTGPTGAAGAAGAQGATGPTGSILTDATINNQTDKVLGIVTVTAAELDSVTIFPLSVEVRL